MKTAPKGLIEFLKSILWFFLRLLYRVEIVGLEKVPEKGRIMICPNHVTSMDMFFIGAKMKRLVRWMAKAELWNNKLVGFVIERLGAFPVHRGKGDVSAVKNAIDLLEQEEALGLFPEGQRRKSSLKKGYRIHSGAGMIAAKTNTPILPVAIDGTAKLFGRVKIVFGDPFYLDVDPEKVYSYKEYVALSKSIMERVYGLIGKKGFEDWR